MKATCSKAEMLSTPMKRVTEAVYIWLKRKMRAEGRGPTRENSRNSVEIIRIAAKSGSSYFQLEFHSITHVTEQCCKYVDV